MEDHRKQKHVFPLFGKNISHSKAPSIHNFIFQKLNLPWEYVLFDSDDIQEFQSKYYSQRDFFGSAITMPNKVTMVNHVDELDEGAKVVGAINTIYKKSPDFSVSVGTNTDIFGIRDSFLLNTNAEILNEGKGKPGLVYGGGGACRSAVYALYKFLGCSDIYVVNRFAHEVENLKKSMIEDGGFKGNIIHIKDPQHAKSLINDSNKCPNFIVCTVPDFAPVTDEEQTAFKTLEVFMNNGKGAVLEMCYHPKPETKLFNLFKAANWHVISGIEAMIYQAFAQQVIWTGYEMHQLPTKEAIDFIYSGL